MKKKILSFIFAICLIVPAMFMLSACKDKERLATEKDVQVYAEYDDYKLTRIVLKASVGETTAYLYGGGGFSIDWKTKHSTGSAGYTNVTKALNNESEIVSHYANLLYNYKYSFILPEEIGGVGDYAFGYTSLTSFETDYIWQLGKNPFVGCKALDSIKINDKYSICPYDTRNNCNAIIKDDEIVATCKNTIIPSTVTKIGDEAFRGNFKTSLNVPSFITEIGEKAFYESSIRDITLPNSITTIGKLAFSECKSLDSIQLPDSISVLNYGLFKNSGLTSFKLTNSIETIDEDILYCCNLQTIDIGNYNKDLTFLFDEYIRKNYINTLLVSEDNTRYSDCNNSNVIVEKDTNKLILGCKNSILDDTIQIIGDSAFANSSITSIVLPNNLITIESKAFYGSDLNEIEFNDKLTTIGGMAFAKTDLTILTLLKEDLTIGGGAFADISTLEYVVVDSQFNVGEIFDYTSLADLIIYYYGTHQEFNNQEDAGEFSGCQVYFYSEYEPSEEGLYCWHFDIDGKTPIVW